MQATASLILNVLFEAHVTSAGPSIVTLELLQQTKFSDESLLGEQSDFRPALAALVSGQYVSELAAVYHLTPSGVLEREGIQREIELLREKAAEREAREKNHFYTVLSVILTAIPIIACVIAYCTNVFASLFQPGQIEVDTKPAELDETSRERLTSANAFFSLYWELRQGESPRASWVMLTPEFRQKYYNADFATYSRKVIEEQRCGGTIQVVDVKFSGGLEALIKVHRTQLSGDLCEGTDKSELEYRLALHEKTKGWSIAD